MASGRLERQKGVRLQVTVAGKTTVAPGFASRLAHALPTAIVHDDTVRQARWQIGENWSWPETADVVVMLMPRSDVDTLWEDFGAANDRRGPIVVMLEPDGRYGLAIAGLIASDVSRSGFIWMAADPVQQIAEWIHEISQAGDGRQGS